MNLTLKKSMRLKFNQGFTLVEIAIVLLIVGLLIGGILRGQELITSARVRNMIDQKSSIQAGMISFQDRYRMLPGDLTAEQAAVVGPTVVPMHPTFAAGFGDVPTVFFQNLTVTGFISCGACMSVTGWAPVPNVNNSPVNSQGDSLYVSNTFGGGINIPTGINFNDRAFLAMQNEPKRFVLTTGSKLSPQMLAETDRKVDDGDPARGSFRLQALSDKVIDQPWICAPGNAATGFQWSLTNNGARCQGGWLF
jgi:prepilin-type N-terminal cleavage/methylation domain-containing protein